jgi:hypothetical protein
MVQEEEVGICPVGRGVLRFAQHRERKEKQESKA